MENTLIVALARQSVLARQMDAVANNLANLNTAGFKSESMIFKERPESTGKNQVISLVHDVGYFRDISEGPLTNTENPLDLAIRGEGYFAVETDEGQRYTRHGVFQLNDQGQLITSQGHPVLGAGGAPISIPPNSSNVIVARDGTISADALEIGRIEVFTFENPAALSKTGNSLYDAKGQEPQATRESDIVQGMVEGSNVNGIAEMTRMISIVRSYQAASSLIDKEHQRILDAIDALVTEA
ncbi:MAG: flagellar basal-body rod protein FlgF [Alphaproteobacteria bacterium]